MEKEPIRSKSNELALFDLTNTYKLIKRNFFCGLTNCVDTF